MERRIRPPLREAAMQFRRSHSLSTGYTAIVYSRQSGRPKQTSPDPTIEQGYDFLAGI